MCIKFGGSESLNYAPAEAAEVKTLSAAFNPQLVRRMNVYHKVRVDGIKCREVCTLCANHFGFASQSVRQLLTNECGCVHDLSVSVHVCVCVTLL